MTMSRRQHSGEFKAKVVLEALRGERTINELAAEYGVHPMQITQWKRVALDELPKVLSNRRGTNSKDEEALKAALYQQIGQLKVELDWLKKKGKRSPRVPSYAAGRMPWFRKSGVGSKDGAGSPRSAAAQAVVT